MSGATFRHYDVAIVGAGPVGSLCALAHARKGARVALLEANPKASKRLAGEWLHPPAVRMLRGFGIELDAQSRSATGNGFVVFPEDGSEPIVLPYPDGAHGLVCEHAALVSRLREAVENESGADCILHARVRAVEDGRVTFTRNGTDESVTAARIVGADGRASIVRRSLGLSTSPVTCSRMMGFILRGVRLPLEGYGHVLCGGPGPVLIYRLGEHCVRVIVDVPVDRWTPRDRIDFLSDSYAGVLPETLRPAFVEALRAGQFQIANNALRPRVTYGSPRRVLIGDAAGHYHPLTAVGMTLGFGDALTLAEGEDFHDFTTRRAQATRAPEFLAMGFYEVFADNRAEVVAIRHAVYRRWRAKSAVRDRTMRLLACEDTSAAHLGREFGVTMARAVAGEMPRSSDQLAWRRAGDIVQALAVRLWWLLRGLRKLHKARSAGGEKDERVRDTLARAFPVSMPSSVSDPQPSRPGEAASPDAGPALRGASAHLLNLQGEDGAWEGEMVWCPMITARNMYCCTTLWSGRSSPAGAGVCCAPSNGPVSKGGVWGLHEHSPPSLFVTTLVYVATRLLGIERDDPFIEPAPAIPASRGGVLGIPSWGKVLAGTPQPLRLARGSTPFCRSCGAYRAGSRYILRIGTATLGSSTWRWRRFIRTGSKLPVTSVIASLREELFPPGVCQRRFFCGPQSRLRGRRPLRATPVCGSEPGIWVCTVYSNGSTPKGLRARCLETIIRHIKWELQTTNQYEHPLRSSRSSQHSWPYGYAIHTTPIAARALAKLDDWGLGRRRSVERASPGARSISWDTGFSLQSASDRYPNSTGVRRRPPTRGRRLPAPSSKSVPASQGFREAYRTDPKGGWCFAGEYGMAGR